MPRGFLVKRSRRPGGSYRARPRERDRERDRDPPPPPAAAAGGSPAARPPPPPGPALKRPSRAKAPGKKAKATRKLSFADEVTTSPVLGLRIKEEGPEGRPGPGPPPSGGRTPLGEFICQLCKEHYADPLALAQHRCSRIVRVEYRCPECHKIFSCPANLASHRRWHKPRPGPSADGSSAAAAAAPPGKENTPAPAPGGPGPGPGPVGEAFACPCCQKRFRRQAYLRKHLGTHGAARPAAFGPPERGQLAFACHLCGARFPSADIRDKHRLWHAVREELLLPPPPPPPAAGQPEGGGAAAAGGGERQGFPCKHCPATFFSAPGLARHATKCHPPEGRQVLLLQVPVRPGC
ncbi:insulinoma-associated protein 2 [Aythya fuligula]|uniref:Insulinoma-associated protein 2 n=1 Tax=Aythya fuligula TaxID=219594 RepID=A0A6J3D3S1_AYTFU|nr:insulinoma-associated protein 2 [Aythya fuligula]